MAEDYYPEEEERPGKVRRVLRIIAILLVVGVYLILFFRMCTDGATRTTKAFLYNQTTLDAYAACTDKSAFCAYTQKIPEDLDEITTKAGNRFAFFCGYVNYLPVAKQFQLTVRYNRSITRSIAAEYGVAEPDNHAELFTFALRDQAGNLYRQYDSVMDSRNVNRFQRLLFDEVPFDTVTELTLCIFCKSAPLQAEPLFTMEVFSTARPAQSVKLDVPAAPTAGLITHKEQA